MEQNQEPTDKSTPRQSIDLQQGYQEGTMGTGVSPVNGAGKLNFRLQKNETGPLLYTTHKTITRNGLKTNIRPETINPMTKTQDNTGVGNDFLRMIPKAQATKPKINK
ncbi:unnamed protein product [Rangifer tarandus platyrhynchus]|uniref:Uncharacterized protein n=2 Tax=Rangifer tarandus platyrhynchus TaxID=3082113 RepID=A0ABN8ZHE9_RANTA|nr:unnamed protein product [Rangifer tarandus platyrhynchus]